MVNMLFNKVFSENKSVFYFYLNKVNELSCQPKIFGQPIFAKSNLSLVVGRRKQSGEVRKKGYTWKLVTRIWTKIQIETAKQLLK